jgi:di/tricarboxylate transporter
MMHFTTDIALVLAVLAGTIALFVSERLRVDVIAILIMIALAWLRLVTPAEAFSGLASTAVVSIIGVMIIGYGIDRSGVMNQLIRPIVRVAGTNELKMTGIISTAASLLSGFMQNIGAAALFLPAMMRISKRTGIPASRLLMPLGFAAILGGTLTLVGSGPLIILNDLVSSGGDRGFGLFSVTPVGAALVAAGILYFLIFGRILLPSSKLVEAPSPQREIVETWELPTTINACLIPRESPIVGKTCEEVQPWGRYNINILSMTEAGETQYAPWRHTSFVGGQELALLGDQADFERFVGEFGLEPIEDTEVLNDLRSSETAGFAEVIIPPRSPVIGKTIREIAMRKNYSVEPVILLSGDREVRTDFSDTPIEAGNTIIVHGLWGRIAQLADKRTFVTSTQVEAPPSVKSNPLVALFCFLVAIVMALSGIHLALSLMTGALAMIVLGVVPIDEAYKAIDWRTVFLLAGLIPLGIAMEKTGAAEYVAYNMMHILENSHPLLIMTAVAILATLFSLFMSNVAATVLLVPLVMVMGRISGISPRALALLVAVCASNSFILPTHQVNALLMSPGGYRNADYFKAGGLMTIIFILIAVGLIYIIFV